MAAHSRIGASGAGRWMTCAGSVPAIEKFGGTSSTDFAREGTAAHELGELCLNEGIDPFDHFGDVIVVEENGEKYEYEVNAGMIDAVTVYVEYCRKIIDQADEHGIEESFALDHYHPDIWGTSDFWAVLHDKKRLLVADYKHGAGVPVYPENNPQLQIYALGVHHKLGLPDDYEVIIVIVQPRADEEKQIKVWETTGKALLEFGEEVREAAAVTDQDDPPFKAGPHCKKNFCPLAGTCPTLKNFALGLASVEFDEVEQETVQKAVPVAGMTPDMMALVMQQAKLVDHWLKAVREQANKMAMEGSPPTGFKLVRGQANRRYSMDDEDTAGFLSVYGLSDEEIYKKKLRPFSEIIKTVGNAAFKRDLEDDILEQPQGSLTLVPDSDVRDGVDPSPEANFEEVK